MTPEVVHMGYMDIVDSRGTGGIAQTLNRLRLY